MEDTVPVVNCVDPVKAFQSLAKIIGDKEGMMKPVETGAKRQSLMLKIQMYLNWTYVRGIILWDILLHHLRS